MQTPQPTRRHEMGGAAYYGPSLACYRKLNGVKLEEVARRMKVPGQYVFRYETADATPRDKGEAYIRAVDFTVRSRERIVREGARLYPDVVIAESEYRRAMGLDA